MTRIGKALLIITALLAASETVFAENINGQIAGSLNKDGDSVLFKPEELIVVNLESRPQFQEGLELKISIPRELRNYQNSFALMLFKNVTPPPLQERHSYRGTRAFMRLLTSRNSMFIRVPLISGHNITADALTDVLPVPVEADEFPLIVTLLPVMKGIPNAAFNKNLEISMQSLWKKEGTLTVSISNLSGSEEEKIKVFIDGELSEPDKAVSLSAGIHRVRVESTHASTIEKNVAIEPGGQIVLPVELDYRMPEILVKMPPRGAEVFLDNKPLKISQDSTLIPIKPGNHSVEYRLGDLSVYRDFTVNPGDRVNIELVLDVNIRDFAEGPGNTFGSGDG